MAKTRMLKHDLRRSLKVASWPIEVRYFWTLLWGYVDDHGKGVDSPLLVKADCFPLDAEITGDTIDKWLWQLADDGVIARYTHAGTDYIQIINWREHQKPPHPTEDVLPNSTAPESTLRPAVAPFMHDAGVMHEELTPVLGLGWVKSGIGSEIEYSPAVSDHDIVSLFDEAYEAWPKKVERKRAFEQFKVAARKRDADLVLADIHLFADAYAATTEKQFVPALGVWLRGERWTDELPTAQQSRKPDKTQKTLDVLEMGRQLQEQEDRKAIL